MTDLEKLQRILTHPGYRVTLGANAELGRHLTVYQTTSGNMFDGGYTEFRISLFYLPDCPVISISPFIHDSNYDGEFLTLKGDDVVKLYKSTMDKLINNVRDEILSAFNLPIEGDTK